MQFSPPWGNHLVIPLLKWTVETILRVYLSCSTGRKMIRWVVDQMEEKDRKMWMEVMVRTEMGWDVERVESRGCPYSNKWDKRVESERNESFLVSTTTTTETGSKGDKDRTGEEGEEGERSEKEEDREENKWKERKLKRSFSSTSSRLLSCLFYQTD